MTQQSSIDLIYFSEENVSADWEGLQVCVPVYEVGFLKKQTNQLLQNTSAEWILFWDMKLGKPDRAILNKLGTKPVDLWHGGLKLGAAGKPDVLNYVHPTWMYNTDSDVSVTHTNFRSSFRACMVRVSALKKLGGASTDYEDLTMAGIAMGYKWLKQGAIVRYSPEMLESLREEQVELPLYDEFVFSRQFFTKKWQYWTLLNKRGFFKNLTAWRKTKQVKYIEHKPCLYSSEKTDEIVQPKTVSVLAPTLDRYSYLEEELRELNEQTILPHEVLITDQTDEQRRQQLDFSKYKNLTVKYFPQKEKGQCLAWNKLIEESTGEYIFFFGDDAYNIKPDMIEKMLQTMQRFDADMVASNVIEKGIVYDKQNYHYYTSDSFPITLIKKSVVEKAGGMDMFFNRNVKADGDLAMRCHLNGALMIFDPSAEIGHHRAPAGGLRAHNARVVTNFMTKNSVTKVLNPSTSEVFIYNKYFCWKQFKQYVRIKYFNQILIKGNILKKILRLIVLCFKSPFMYRAYKKAVNTTLAEFDKRGIAVKK